MTARCPVGCGGDGQGLPALHGADLSPAPACALLSIGLAWCVMADEPSRGSTHVAYVGTTSGSNVLAANLHPDDCDSDDECERTPPIVDPVSTGEGLESGPHGGSRQEPAADRAANSDSPAVPEVLAAGMVVIAGWLCTGPKSRI